MRLFLENLLGKAELATLGIGSPLQDAVGILGEPEYVVAIYDDVIIHRYGVVEIAFKQLKLVRFVVGIDLLRTETQTYPVSLSDMKELDSGETCLAFLNRRSIKYEIPTRALSGHFCTTSAGVRIYCQMKAKLTPPSVGWSLANDVVAVSAGWL